MKKILPPSLFLFCILLMVVLYYWAPGVILIPYPINLIGIVFVPLGWGIPIRISRKFASINTEIHTFKRPGKLTTNGLFKYTRNPIYLGFLVGLIGTFILLGNVTSMIGVILFFISANFWYIPFEEKQLEKEFGGAYKAYKSRVRRWI